MPELKLLWPSVDQLTTVRWHLDGTGITIIARLDDKPVKGEGEPSVNASSMLRLRDSEQPELTEQVYRLCHWLGIRLEVVFGHGMDCGVSV